MGSIPYKNVLKNPDEVILFYKAKRHGDFFISGKKSVTGGFVVSQDRRQAGLGFEIKKVIVFAYALESVSNTTLPRFGYVLGLEKGLCNPSRVVSDTTLRIRNNC